MKNDNVNNLNIFEWQNSNTISDNLSHRLYKMIKIIFNNNNKIKTWKSTQSIEIYTIRTHTKKKMITSTSQQKPSDLTRPQNAHRFHFYTHPPHPPSPFYISHRAFVIEKKRRIVTKTAPTIATSGVNYPARAKTQFFQYLFVWLRPPITIAAMWKIQFPVNICMHHRARVFRLKIVCVCAIIARLDAAQISNNNKCIVRVQFCRNASMFCVWPIQRFPIRVFFLIRMICAWCVCVF